MSEVKKLSEITLFYLLPKLRIEEQKMLLIQFLDKNPQHLRANQEIASLYQKEDNFQKSLDVFLGLHQQQSENLEFIQEIIFNLQHLQAFDKAINFCNKAIAIDRQNPDFYYLKASCYARKGEYFKALSYIEKTLSIDVNHAYAWYEKGCILNAMKQYIDSNQAYDKAIAIDERFFTAYFNKACNYSVMQEVEDSLESLEQALDLYPNLIENCFNERELENIKKHPNFENLLKKYQEV